jgi:16S rRNA (adenine1518-N6/adenine1519-N6)-dimethyltransferase
MPSPLQILRLYGIEPRRSRGQNFLVDQNIIRKIIDHADLKKTDRVVEIGAGIGVLTQELASRVKKVFAVEIDARLVKILKERFGAVSNVVILHEDARKISNARFGTNDSPFRHSEGDSPKNPAHLPYRVIANIPYNLTAFLIRKFLEEEPRPRDMVLMVQKEVGQRLCAKAPDMSMLSAMAGYYAVPKILFGVSKTCFFPVPKVDSVCISLVLDPDRHPASDEARLFTRLLKAGFSAKRKFVVKNLSRGLGAPIKEIRTAFQRLGLPPTSRAQELTVDDWLKICHSIIEP